MATFFGISSVNSAVRLLQSTQKDLQTTESRLASGLRVAAARDNPSAWRVASGIRSSRKTIETAQSILETEAARVATAKTATSFAGTVLGELKTQLAAAKTEGADLTAIQSRIAALKAQLRSTAAGSSFEGRNLLSVDSGASNYASQYSFLSSVAQGPNNQTSLQTMGVRSDFVTLYDSGSAASGILQKEFGIASVAGVAASATAPSLDGLRGAATAIAGAAAGAAPSTAGLSGTASTVLGEGGAARAAKVVIDSPAGSKFSAAGDTLEIALTYNGTTKTAKAYTRQMGTATAAKTEIQRALNAEFGAGNLVANVDSGFDITIETAATGSNQSLTLGSFAVADGDDVLTGNLNLLPDPGAHWVYNSEVGGQNRSSSIQRNINMNNIDTSDSIKLKIKSVSAGTYSQADGRYGANGTVQTFEVTVSLATVWSRDSLANAINNAFSSDPTLNSYFGAAIGTERGGGAAQLMIYHKTYGSSIEVMEVTRVNGNGATEAAPYTLTTVTGSSGAVAASATTGSDFAGPLRLAGSGSLSFDLSVNGAATAVTVNQATVDAALAGDSGYVAGSGRIDTVAQYAAVVQRAVTNAGINNIQVAASGARLRFTRTGTPTTGDAVSVSNAQAGAASASQAMLRTGSAFTGPRTLSATGTLRFGLAVDGAAARTVEVSRATVDAALAAEPGYAAGSGTIANAAQFARAVARGLANAGLSGVDVAADGNRLLFSRSAAGAGSLAISNLQALTGAFDAGGLTVDTLDVGPTPFANLRTDQRAAVIDAMIAGVEARAVEVAAAESYLGSVARRIDIQQRYNDGLDRIMSSRLSSLVDADMEEERVRKAALEARQSLALQRLEMMNASQRTLLQLFDRKEKGRFA